MEGTHLGDVVVEAGLGGETPVTNVAAEGLLVIRQTSVMALQVALEVGQLCKGLAAAFHRALVWPFACKVTTVGQAVRRVVQLGQLGCVQVGVLQVVLKA